MTSSSREREREKDKAAFFQLSLVLHSSVRDSSVIFGTTVRYRGYTFKSCNCAIVQDVSLQQPSISIRAYNISFLHCILGINNTDLVL